MFRNESKSIKEANKVALGNEKYKGYMIRLDRKYGCYNVYDKEDEMEDSGFRTIDKAGNISEILKINLFNPNSIIHIRKYLPSLNSAFWDK